MPTLLIAFGIRFFFYMDEHEPIHVLISYGGKKALNTCNNYRDEFISEWHKCFGND